MKRTARKGFTLIELVLVLAILASLFMTYSKWSIAESDNALVKQEELNAYRIEAGLKNSFTSILDGFEGVCGNITSDATASMGWGWGNAACSGTSPLPKISGKNILYSINFNSLSAAATTSLKNKIVAAYDGACTVSTSNSTSLTLFCGGAFSNLQYETSAGTVTQYHTPGSSLNYLDMPTPVITVNRRLSAGGTPRTITYRLTLADVFEQREAYSISKLENIGKMMKSIYNAHLTQETMNLSPAGLNVNDDEFIPWHWMSFGDNKALTASTVCAKNAVTGVCDNLNTINIWRSTTGDAVLWRRFVSGYLAGDFKYTVDGFGNPLRVIPILSQCANDLSLCSPTAPTSPRTPYTLLAQPAYTTLIYSNVSNGGTTCSDLSTQAPASCRYSIVY